MSIKGFSDVGTYACTTANKLICKYAFSFFTFTLLQTLIMSKANCFDFTSNGLSTNILLLKTNSHSEFAPYFFLIHYYLLLQNPRSYLGKSE